MEAANQVWTPYRSATATALGDEVANSITHGAGLLLSLCGVERMNVAMHGRGSTGQVAGAMVFVGSMVVLYLASTLYHAVQAEGLKKCLRTCDHAAIYLLIAGTYTPFLLALEIAWCPWCLTAVWCLALAGVCFKVLFGFRYEKLSVATYLLLGWAGVLVFQPLVERISYQGVAWLVAGGLAYSFGTIFYVRSHIKYCHAAWHLFVLLGSALHYGAIVYYVVPRTFG